MEEHCPVWENIGRWVGNREKDEERQVSRGNRKCEDAVLRSYTFTEKGHKKPLKGFHLGNYELICSFESPV